MSIAVKWLALAGLVLAAAPSGTAAAEPRTLPVQRDLWLSNVGREADGNNGGAARLKVKSIQEMTLVDFDAAQLRGFVVESATLHLRLAGDERLWRVTVGGVAAPWIEGTGFNYSPQAGTSTFRHRQHPDRTWDDAGGELTSVILGQGHTLWRMADAWPPDAAGWQRVAVDPDVISACVAELSYGLIVFDDTGSEWTRDGEKFTYRVFPNRFLFSREAGPERAPYLKVVLGAADQQPPEAPVGVTFSNDQLPSGEFRLSWVTPADAGPAGTLGFQVEIDGRPAPRHLIPLAAAVGQPVAMHVRQLDLQANAKVAVSIRAVDRAGNVGPPAAITARTARPAPITIPAVKSIVPAGETGGARRLGPASVAIVDMGDTVVAAQPLRLTPAREEKYLLRNHVWDAGTGRIQLAAARNEHTGFQVLVAGPADGLRAELQFAADDGPAKKNLPRIEWGQVLTVPGAHGPVFDPVLPIPDGVVRRQVAANAKLPVQDLLCEVYVPHDATPGNYTGTLKLSTGDATLELAVKLTVRPFTLPDFLSFIPEMNCYGLPANERDYYRLAHRHRTVLNRVPYSQGGAVEDGCAPSYQQGKLDWSRWDRRFGPLLDGSAFADLPRRGVPLECFYLPIHENWPSRIEPNYNGSYWADEAFTDTYRDALVDVSRQFAEHLSQQGWHDTMFQGFWNNKVDFKRNGWSRGSSPWLLDEPANWHDYWALRWYGRAFHEGVQAAKPSANLAYRCDISRPEWQRDALDDVLDYNVVQGGAFQRYRSIVLDRKRQFHQTVVVYGATCLPSGNHLQPVTWCWYAWLSGADGVLPWQTVGIDRSWDQEEDTCVLYRGRRVGVNEPLASLRLKAYQRGQQDAEYLTLCGRAGQSSREQVAEAVLRLMDQLGVRWQSQVRGTGAAVAEDAGRIEFDQVRSDHLAQLRDAVAAAIATRPPAPNRRLVDFRSPPRIPIGHPAVGGYVSRGDFPPRRGGPGGSRAAAVGQTAPPPAISTIVRTLQGRGEVRDALIDPALPDRNLGAEPRDNRLNRSDSSSALLVRFDLERLPSPRPQVIDRATLSIFVWDPSAKGRMKVHVAAVQTAWDERTAAWNRAGEGRPWQGGTAFVVGRDSGPWLASTVLEPDSQNDLADPPVEYTWDITELVRAWHAGQQANHGLVLLPVADRAVDDGEFSRVQIYASEFRDVKVTPRLTIAGH